MLIEQKNLCNGLWFSNLLQLNWNMLWGPQSLKRGCPWLHLLTDRRFEQDTIASSPSWCKWCIAFEFLFHQRHANMRLDCPKKTAWSNIVSLQGKRTSPGRHRTMCSPPGSYCSTELSSVELGLLKTRATCNLLLPIGICIPGQHEKELTQWVPFGWCLQSQISVDFPYETKFCVSYDITF